MFWYPEMECLENIDLWNVSMSEAAKYTRLCRVDKRQTWVPRIRHSNAVYDPNYYMQ